MNKNKNILGILAATAIGMIIGVLFAPNKGKETRKRYKEEADNAKNKIKEDAEILKGDFSETFHKQKNIVSNKINKGLQNASKKADGIIDNIENFLKNMKEKNQRFQVKNS